MKKRIALFLAAAMTLSLMACGSSSGDTASTGAASTQSAQTDSSGTDVAATDGASADTGAEDPYAALEPLEITCVTIHETSTSTAQALYHMAERLEEESGGKVTMTIYDSGQTGGEAEQAEAMLIGEVDMGAFGTLPITTYTPEYSFFDCPFIFMDKDHMMNAWNGDVGDRLRADLEEVGIHTIGAMGRGYRNITSSVPIEGIEDFQGLIIRTPQTEMFTEAFGALGCVTVPIALTELFTSLQTGVAQASEGPWDQIVSNKLYEVQNYLIEATYYYATSTFMCNKDWYDALPVEYQTLIDEVGAEALEWGTAYGESMMEDLKQQCIDYGCTVTSLGDMTPYIEMTADRMARLYEENWPVTTPEEIASYK